MKSVSTINGQKQPEMYPSPLHFLKSRVIQCPAQSVGASMKLHGNPLSHLHRDYPSSVYTVTLVTSFSSQCLFWRTHHRLDAHTGRPVGAPGQGHSTSVTGGY